MAAPESSHRLISVPSCRECPMLSFQDEPRCMHPDGFGWQVLNVEFNHVRDVHPECPLRKSPALVTFDPSEGGTP